jgi:hypothetical protein
MKAHILGLGESLIYYEPDGAVTIGVNDIYRYHKADYIVCVDLPRVFTEERLNIITGSRPKEFITLFPEWCAYYPKTTTRLISKAPAFRKFSFIDSHLYPCSNNSPFVATIHAYRLGAKEIILHGVDLKNHHALSREKTLAKAMKEYKLLNQEFQKREVKLYVGNYFSALSSFLPVYQKS